MSELKEWQEAGCPLKCEKQLIKIREDVRRYKNHRGANKVLVKAARNEIRSFQGKKKMNLDCGSCMRDANKLLMNWFSIYDKRTTEQKRLAENFYSENKGVKFKNIATGVKDNDELIDLDTRRKVLEEMDYWDLKDKIPELPQEAQDRIKEQYGHRPPSQAVIIDELLKL